MAVTMQTPLSRVLGPKTAASMAEQLHLETVRDLLRHYPRRYARRGEQVDLAEVQVGDRVTVLAQVRSVSSRPMVPSPALIRRVISWRLATAAFACL